MRPHICLVLSMLLALLVTTAFAEPCEVQDNGTGTIDLPPDCPGGLQGPMTITAGLPPGTTLEIDATLTNYWSIVTSSGGSLGGEWQEFQADLQWIITGTGDLAGFARNLTIPVMVQTHTAPRTPGDPEQAFDQLVYVLEGQLFGDPDFCQLVVVAGNGHGMPSPGHCILTSLPTGKFNVDSFFDVTYRIDFMGCPGSILDGLSGSTMDTDHFVAGELYTSPNPEHSCILPDNGTGTVDLPPGCPDGFVGDMRIVDGLYPGSTLEIAAVLTDFVVTNEGPGGSQGGEFQQFDALLQWEVTGTGVLTGFVRNMSIPVTGEMHTGPRNPGDPVQSFDQDLMSLSGQHYGDPDFCTLRVIAGTANGLPSPGHCTLTRLPSGDFAVDSFFDITYQIEFEGCPGSVLESLAGTTTDTDRFQAGEEYFPLIEHSCLLPDNGFGTIDMPPECPDGYQGTMRIIDGLPPGTTIDIDAVLTNFMNVVRYPGGQLSGEVQDFDASLVWDMVGTGDLAGFQRNITIPVSGQIHTAPRTLGDPVQVFDQTIFLFQGQLFGDPDFCTLVVAAGDGYGLPAPGSTTLTQVPNGDFAVDSFFDITYQIEFEGCPGSIIDGLVGTTTATDRFQAGELYTTAINQITMPTVVMLRQNDPNPFNPITTIYFTVPEGAGLVSLDVYDLRGQHVRSLVHEQLSVGPQLVDWNARDEQGRKVSAGVYLYALQTDAGREVRKMALIK